MHRRRIDLRVSGWHAIQGVLAVSVASGALLATWLGFVAFEWSPSAFAVSRSRLGKGTGLKPASHASCARSMRESSFAGAWQPSFGAIISATNMYARNTLDQGGTVGAKLQCHSPIAHLPRDHDAVDFEAGMLYL